MEEHYHRKSPVRRKPHIDGIRLPKIPKLSFQTNYQCKKLTLKEAVVVKIWPLASSSSAKRPFKKIVQDGMRNRSSCAEENLVLKELIELANLQ